MKIATIVLKFRPVRMMMKVVCSLALLLASSSTGWADYKIVNHSNDVVSVAVTYTQEDGRMVTTGWKVIPVGDERTVYYGNEPKICVAMLKGANRNQIIPGRSHGTFNRFVHANVGFSNRSTDTPWVSELSWDGQTYYVNTKTNTPLPAGWYSQRFFVLNGNETFTVVP